jgi:aspartyl-tRNA(Asn)/glutamyl-tRNA(Gln) amidotransferase subunit A
MAQHTLTALELSAQIKSGAVSVADAAASCALRITQFDATYHAMVSVYDKPALPQTPTASPLFGVPVIVKDNINVKGRPMTCSSKILKGYVAPYDAHVVERMKAAGMVIIGSANMDEFAFGSSCETSCYGPTSNPFDPARVPGGSSGGSAAAAGLAYTPITLGSDTGGSIRQPAAFCNVLGLKPTYGLVSRYGLTAFGSSLDQIGPFCRDAGSMAAFMDVIAGKDERDSTSMPNTCGSFAKALTGDVKGLRIGLPKEYFIDGVDADVRRGIDDAKKVLEAQGATFTEVSLPHTKYAVAVYYILASSEASTNLSRFDGIRYGARVEMPTLHETYVATRHDGFGKEAKRRILLGTFSLSSGYYDAYYGKAQRVRTLITKDFTDAFKDVDVILTPTAPTPPFKKGEKGDDPIQMYLSDIFTIPASLAGVPAISVPCGATAAGLPLAFQLIGPHFSDARLLNVTHAFQQKTTHHTRLPDAAK